MDINESINAIAESILDHMQSYYINWDGLTLDDKVCICVKIWDNAKYLGRKSQK